LSDNGVFTATIQPFGNTSLPFGGSPPTARRFHPILGNGALKYRARRARTGVPTAVRPIRPHADAVATLDVVGDPARQSTERTNGALNKARVE
jgi:hypothetical protein